VDTDKDQIAEVLIRYATGIDSKDWSLLRSCWTDEIDVDYQQLGRFASADAIIINRAAYSFTSIAMIDACKTFEGPIIEVHISNIHARDELHRHSKLSSAVKAVIAGLGPYGYIVAMQAALLQLVQNPLLFRGQQTVLALAAPQLWHNPLHLAASLAHCSAAGVLSPNTDAQNLAQFLFGVQPPAQAVPPPERTKNPPIVVGTSTLSTWRRPFSHTARSRALWSSFVIIAL